MGENTLQRKVSKQRGSVLSVNDVSVCRVSSSRTKQTECRSVNEKRTCSF
jgi:hypothetical protein